MLRAPHAFKTTSAIAAWSAVTSEAPSFRGAAKPKRYATSSPAREEPEARAQAALEDLAGSLALAVSAEAAARLVWEAWAARVAAGWGALRAAVARPESVVPVVLQARAAQEAPEPMRQLAVALLSFGIAASASAQTDSPDVRDALPNDEDLAARLDDPATTASDAYDLGVRMFEAKRYGAAERAWMRAYGLDRDPKLLVAIADTRQRRGDEPGAVAMLEQYLVERPDAPDRTSIEARIATLLKSPARLVVRSAEPGHSILLDDVPTEKRTPATLEVEPGEHSVLVVADGRQMGGQTVRVGYGEVRDLSFTGENESQVIARQSEEAKRRAQLAIEEEDETIRRAVVATGSIAAAALLSGTVLGALSFRDDRRDREDSSAATADRSDRRVLFSYVSFGVAALSAITSFTLFMTHKNERERARDTARLRIEARGAGASATIRF